MNKEEFIVAYFYISVFIPFDKDVWKGEPLGTKAPVYHSGDHQNRTFINSSTMIFSHISH